MSALTEDSLKQYLGEVGVHFLEEPLQGGVQLRCPDGEVFCIYSESRGKVVPQGRPTALLLAIEWWQKTGSRPPVQEPGLVQRAVAALYERLFVLENTIRTAIEHKLKEAYGRAWLEAGLPDRIRKTVIDRAKHPDRDWRGGPDEPSLIFVGFGDLADIIQVDKQREPHKRCLQLTPQQADAVVAELHRLEPLRDDIGHMRTLPSRERDVFVSLVDDLQNLRDNKAAR